MKRVYNLLVILLVLPILTVGHWSLSEAAYPDRDIELVVPFSAGGGSHITGQIIAQIMTEEKIIPVNMPVVCKPGGAMAVGMAYTAAKKGNPHYIMLLTNSFLITPMKGGVSVNKDDFTPIVLFGSQLSLLCSNPDGQFKTLGDAVKYAKENPGKLTIAVSGNTHQMWASMLSDSLGIELTAVPFSGTAPCISALLGKHVDLAIVNLTEGRDFIETKKLLGLGITSKKRVDAVPDIPTFAEQGIKGNYDLFRGMVAPASIPEDARQFLGAAFKKLCESERWQKEYVDKTGFLSDPIYLDDADRYLNETEALYGPILKKLGIVK